MRILDQNDIELNESDIDYEKGYLTAEKLFIQHHEAVEAVEEEGHFEVIKEYPNGGKDVDWVIDVEAVEAVDAWDEYEEVFRFIEYTAEEIAERAKAAEEAYKNSPEYRMTQIETMLARILDKLGVDISEVT